jgi:hypothetical protein
MTYSTMSQGKLGWENSFPTRARRDSLPRSRDANRLSLEQAEIEASLARSRYLSSRMEAVYKVENKLNEFWQLEADWNSYGAKPPHRNAMDNALQFSGRSIDFGIHPDRIEPSAEGGVAIAFLRGDRRAIAEFLNDGSSDLLLYDKQGNLRETAAASATLDVMIEEIREYLELEAEAQG